MSKRIIMRTIEEITAVRDELFQNLNEAKTVLESDDPEEDKLCRNFYNGLRQTIEPKIQILNWVLNLKDKY